MAAAKTETVGGKLHFRIRVFTKGTRNNFNIIFSLFIALILKHTVQNMFQKD